MQIVGGELYCEIFFPDEIFPYFFIFSKPFNFFLINIVSNYLCLIIFNIILNALLNPYLKNSTQTIFQGDTSWLAQLLNNIIVWMVLYCEHQLLGLKKNKTLSPPFFG